MRVTKEELVAYLRDRTEEELAQNVEDISEAVEGYIEESVEGVVGTMVKHYGTRFTAYIDGSQLERLIRSSIITGYLAKCAEDRLLLEKNFKNKEAS